MEQAWGQGCIHYGRGSGSRPRSHAVPPWPTAKRVRSFKVDDEACSALVVEVEVWGP